MGRPRGSKNLVKEAKPLLHPVSPNPVLTEEKVNRLAMCLSDPKESRSDQELSVDLEVFLKDIRKLKQDPLFIEPVNQAFKRNLQSIGPEILRKMFRQAMEGSTQSQKSLLEASGWISGPGGKTVINVGGVDVRRDEVSQLSDSDLDREIHRLLMETYPEDCIISEGTVVPLSENAVEILTGGIDVRCDDAGRNNGEGEEGEVVQAASGEAEEDGG